MIVPLRPRLLDAETLVERGCVGVNDFVAVDNGFEKLWVQVVDVKTRDYFDGVVSSRPGGFRAYGFGDLIRFHRRHIQKLRN
jgi:hypothetical protein